MIIMIPLKKSLQTAYYKHTCCEEMMICVVEHEPLSCLQGYSFMHGGPWTGVCKGHGVVVIFCLHFDPPLP